DFSLRLAKNDGIQKVKIALVDSTDTVLASTELIPVAGDWKTYEAVLTPNRTEEKARLKITFEGRGSIDMDLVSLFPQDTWKGRERGLRKDLVELLDGLQPGFLRFPGGCIVEGRTLDQRYQWQKTVGLLKLVYLATKNIERKWTSPLQNWSLTVQQLYIKFGDRLPLDLAAAPSGGTPRRGGKEDRL